MVLLYNSFYNFITIIIIQLVLWYVVNVIYIIYIYLILGGGCDQLCDIGGILLIDLWSSNILGPNLSS